jgi:hypothetical protein
MYPVPVAVPDVAFVIVKDVVLKTAVTAVAVTFAAVKVANPVIVITVPATSPWGTALV